MRVLFITRDSDLPESHLIAGLAAAGIEVRVLGDLLPPIARMFCERGILHEGFAIRSRLDREAARRIRATVREWNPDIVQCFTSRALTCAILSRLPRRVRLVGYRGAIGRLTRLDPSNLFGVLHVRVNAVLCLSDSIRAALRKAGVPDRKLFKIYKGHDPAWYAAANARPRRAADGAFVVGFIGNMRRVKGAHVLLEALRGIDPRLPVRAALVGAVLDPRVRALLADPNLAGRVEVRGFQPNASASIPDFDVLAVPSLEGEGLSKAAIEAMSQRVPVLASASGGLVELIEDRVSGRLVPPGDAAALRAAILELMRDADARTKYADAAYERISTAFHIDRTVEQVAALYRSLVSESRAR
jgi:glycosyltransferase involved in cell wall biosynthesis